MANINGCFLHNKDDWSTPKKLYEALMEKGFSDPYPLFSKEDNLNKIYDSSSRLFINPPYSKIKEWTEFVKRNIKCEILLLIPARTDTRYFSELVKFEPDIFFIKGRLHFGDSSQSAPFPSMIMWFNPYYPKWRSYVNVSLDEFIEIIKKEF